MWREGKFLEVRKKPNTYSTRVLTFAASFAAARKNYSIEVVDFFFVPLSKRLLQFCSIKF
jgi:hypothetical protein